MRKSSFLLQSASYLPRYDSSKGMSVRVGLNGYAELFGEEFTYQSLWSDPATWPGNSLPQEGDDVVIEEGDTVLLDISPPALGVVKIYGQLLLRETGVRACLKIDYQANLLVEVSTFVRSHKTGSTEVRKL